MEDLVLEWQQQKARILAMERLLERAIDWIQHDCPFTREEIMRILAKEVIEDEGNSDRSTDDIPAGPGR